jgi:hypothetical protein
MQLSFDVRGRSTSIGNETACSEASDIIDGTKQRCMANKCF